MTGAVLCCAVLCCAMLCCTVLCCAVCSRIIVLCCFLKALPEPPRLTLVEVQLVNPPEKEMSVFFRLSLGAGATKNLVYESAVDTSKFFCNVIVEDVVQMEFFIKKGSKKKKLCICNFNTLFLDLPTDGSNIMRLPKSRLDKLCKDKKHKKVPEDFQLQLHFRPFNPTLSTSSSSSSLAQSQLVPAASGQAEI